jgi:hypothetical protein
VRGVDCICISRSIAVVAVGSRGCLCVYGPSYSHARKRVKRRKNKEER